MRFLVSLPILVAGCLLGLGLGVPRSAAGAEPSPSEISVARRLFEEGRAAADAARWVEAAGKFRRATAIKDTPGLRFHLARCEEEQGAFVEALIEYDRARELLDGGNKAPDVEKLLPEARERVRGKVALLTLRLPDGVQNASVQLDGKALSASVLGVPMPINPGRHRVHAVAVGRTSYAGEIALGVGEVREVPLELPFATTAPAPPAARSPTASSGAQGRVTPSADDGVSARTITLVGQASLFALGVGTGIGFSISQSSASDRLEAANRQVLAQVGGSDPKGTACSTPRPGCSELQQATRDHDQAQRLAVAGFVTAGVSAAAFGLTLWLWPGSESSVAVDATPNRAYVALSGHF